MNTFIYILGVLTFTSMCLVISILLIQFVIFLCTPKRRKGNIDKLIEEEIKNE